jgi:hypothetical protein
MVREKTGMASPDGPVRAVIPSFEANQVFPPSVLTFTSLQVSVTNMVLWSI